MRQLLKFSTSNLIHLRLSSLKQIKPQTPTKIIDLEKFPPDKIRNFAIVAHVDHGKSTLADRFLQITNVIDKNERAQFLDNLQVEKERGITVKAVTCSMFYKGYLLNLIDTPGHVDFNFEVSRSLSACNGMILLVAANSGPQAQTIANFYLGFEQDLTILPVINKIDLPTANVESVKRQLNALFDFDESEISCISAKSGLGVNEILDLIIEKVPPPKNIDGPFRALIFDSFFEHFRGAIALILVAEGSVVVGQKIRSFMGQKEYEVAEIGILYPDRVQTKKLSTGQVGYIICNMKAVKEAHVGETLYCATTPNEDVKAFAKFTPNKPSIYAGFFPFNVSDYDELKRALERLALNDSSVSIIPDSSSILGLGWKIGFLGMLHLDVFAQRLDQEYDANVILTCPSVEFKAKIRDNETIRKKRYDGKAEILIKDASQFPEHVTDVEAFYEPVVLLSVISPYECSSAVNTLCIDARGERVDTSVITEDKTLIKFRLPLAEVITGFFDELKRITSGYASFDMVDDGYREISLTKLCISINDKPLNELSLVIPESIAIKKAKIIVEKLKGEIPQQQYEVKIKATLGKSTKPICSGTIKPIRKDFTGTMKGNFGGAMDRLAKKLSHQAKGKERMRSVGNVHIPKEAFVNVLRDNRFNS